MIRHMLKSGTVFKSGTASLMPPPLAWLGSFLNVKSLRLFCYLFLGLTCLSMSLQAQATPDRFERDPFAPVKWQSNFKYEPSLLPGNIAIPESKTTVSLNGIIWDKHEPYAIVNILNKQRIIKINDTVEGATVIAIEKTEVKLKSGSETFILKIGKDIHI